MLSSPICPQMQEFVGGSGVYVYPGQYRNLMVELRKTMKPGSKPPATYLACELLSMFYNDKDYRPPCSDPIDQKVINAIISG